MPLWAKNEVRGDVIVRFKRGADGSERPYEAHLYKLDEPAGKLVLGGYPGRRALDLDD